MRAETLFTEHMDLLYRMALFMLSNTHDAEDAVQETYVRYLLKKPKLKDEEHAKAWLMRVCNNICKNQIRYWKRHPSSPISETDISETTLGEQEILREISLLPTKYKSVIILHSIEGYSVKEISNILKISDAAVKKRLQRAREQLKLKIGE